MKLNRLPDRLAIAKFSPDTPCPVDLSAAAGFISVTRTAQELSIVAAEELLADAPEVEAGWTAFAVEGPLAFELVGVLSQLSHVLAEQWISLFVVSTFDTDIILVKADDAPRAASAWRAAGHAVT